MKQILQNSTARLWCLCGLTGMFLITGVLPESGQAHAYSPSRDIATPQIKKLKLTRHSLETINAVKSQLLKSNRENTSEDPSIHKQVTVQKSAKKRMGFAILFLGILAEEG